MVRSLSLSGSWKDRDVDRGRPSRPRRTGMSTTGNSSPLLRWTVMTWTASASDSSRRVRSSFSPSRVRLEDAPPQPGGEGGRPEPSVTPASCSSWPICRRSVMNRSPEGRRRAPAPGRPASWSPTRRGRRPPARAAGGPAVQPPVEVLPRAHVRLVATCSADQPTKRVRAASDARSRDAGCSSASRRRSHSVAGSVAKTEPGPADHGGDAGCSRASHTVMAWLFDLTSTAMSPGCSVGAPSFDAVAAA